jgi:ribosomal protein S18 acetylase RimI-like enzyme
MRTVVADGLRDVPDRSYVHPGDVSWWVGWSPVGPENLSGVCRVWEDGGRDLGWAFVDGDDVGEFVHADVLGTAEADGFWRAVDAWLAEEHPRAMRYASEADRDAIARLHRAGFEPTDDGLLAFRRPLDAIPDRDARVRALARDDDPTGRLRVTKAAFGDDRPFERYVEDYRRFMASPAYPEGWDLVLETGDGMTAACCIAWPDGVSRSGNFEPVATHPSFTRRGFASAVMIEGYRLLRDAGMRWAIVRTPLGNTAAAALYTSLGFVRWRLDRAFSRSTAG